MSPSPMNQFQNYRMPAEWEPHSATWIAWPHEESDWPSKFEPIAWVYVEIVRALLTSEPVRIVCNSPDLEKYARYCLEISGICFDRVSFVVAPNDRSWLRDSAPTGLVPKSVGGNPACNPVWLGWKFNAWAKYENHLEDSKIPDVIAGFSKRELLRPSWPDGSPVVLEGGAIDVDGEGTLLATEECLLSSIQERNPGFVREDYEQIFARYLGVEKVIWLESGIEGDDTHGHIDDITRFVAPGVVVTVKDSNPDSKNFSILEKNLSILKSSSDAKGRKLKILELPMPAPRVFDGQVLPASYANFYIANKCVIVPVFNDPMDRIALNTIAELFPDREVIGIACQDLVLGLGTLHCLTQQEPL